MNVLQKFLSVWLLESWVGVWTRGEQHIRFKIENLKWKTLFSCRTLLVSNFCFKWVGVKFLWLSKNFQITQNGKLLLLFCLFNTLMAGRISVSSSSPLKNSWNIFNGNLSFPSYLFHSQLICKIKSKLSTYT